MSESVPIEAIPNQNFTIRLENRRYEITLQTATGVMAATVVRDNVKLIDSIRCLPDAPLLPYQYLEDKSGNFFFQTENDQLPFYDQFGVTQFLLFFSDAELQELRNGN